ncbi:hypothetical protein ABTX62_10470 [Streptomyces sp. NPDC096046]|uniref:hypothetical protein n=1 Tax=Streptomyces sp. NPDC096046 TaxID=3155542 RepID=UPI003322A0E4
MKRRTAQFGAMTVALTACLAGTATTAQAQPVSLTAETRTVKAAGAPFYPYGKLVHVKSIGTKCGKKPLAKASGPGGTRLGISETKSVSTTLSKNIGVTYTAISAGVGWDVQKSRSITVSGSREVSRGKHGTLTAYAKYSGKKFDVYDKIRFKIVEKNKTAYKPIGVCFTYTEK